jgi:hypothetical protein
MKLSDTRLGAKVLFIILAASMAALSSKPAAAGSFIEVEGRFITIMGRTFCWLNCDELRDPPPIVRQPAILRPKPL